MSANSQFYYPNRMGRIIIHALREVVGIENTKIVLNAAGLDIYSEQLPPADLELSFPFEYVSALQAASESVFGVTDGQDINRRVGRACLTSGLQEFNPLIGIADLPVRAMPLGLKLHVGFDMFAMVFNRFTDQVVRIGEENSHYLWIIERCPVCWGRHVDSPSCQLAVGILEESLAWATGGRSFDVTQVSCIAAGDPTCTIRINKRPVK
ncbi:MAG: 4-vinyl reductase [Anaerolineae bacterium]|nr:4-vinyl reductase [Anaerolineae bacterium]